MNLGSNDLWLELSTMADGFANLGRGLLSASRLLHAPGILPPDSLLDELSGLRSRFLVLREKSEALARSLKVPTNVAGTLNDLKSLAVLLEAIEEAEDRRDEWNLKVVKALAVLDRVLGLRHAKHQEFPALQACQAQARTLRQEIAADNEGALAEVVQSLGEMDHPFAYVLTMAAGAEGVDDDLWESLYASVGAAFGRSFAASVARGKIVAGPETSERVESTSEVVTTSEPHARPAAVLGFVERTFSVEGDPATPAASLEPVSQPIFAAPANSSLDVSDEVLASLAEETVPWLPKGLGTLLTTRRLARAARRKTMPNVERLETVSLMTCNTISGFVFLDSQNSGVYQPALDSALAGNTIELLNSSGIVVAKAVTDANGYYAFSTDSTVNTMPTTLTKTYTIPDQLTNINSQVNVNQFDPSLGTLTQVDVMMDGTLVSQMRVENTSQTSSQVITGSVTGNLSLTGQGVALAASLTNQFGPFDATNYDGTMDYGGTSGIDFGSKTDAMSRSLSLKSSDGTDLSAYQGTGTIPLTFIAKASSPASGGGNVIYDVRTSASANITLVYHYTPSNCLAPGNYKIVQPVEPSGTLNGKDSTNGTVLPPGTAGQPDTIPVTLNNANLANNDFGEIKPAEIKGFVYEDVNKNKLRDSGDVGIANVQVVLQGTDDLGNPVSRTTTTDSTGAYDFPGLRPGTYSTSLPTNPAGYTNWFDSKGNITPIPNSDSTNTISGITIAPGDVASENDFGEIKTVVPLIPAEIKGYVYEDVNKNELRDVSDVGIPNVQVVLQGTDDLGNAVSKTTVTDSTGAYDFPGLRPGTYSTSLPTNPAGYTNWYDSKGNITPIPNSNTTNVINGITVAAGDVSAENDFGEIKSVVPLLPAEIKGYVYEDVNKNKLRDPADKGIPNVQVLLQGTDDLGNAVSQLTVTDANGAYDFPNLRPGTYSTSLPTNPAGYTNWYDSKGNITPIPNSNTTNVISGITIAAGAVSAENDFGEIKAGTPSGGGSGGGGTPNTCTTMPSMIESVKRLGVHHHPTQFVIQFSAPLDPKTATNVNNYQLLIAFRNGKFSKHPMELKQAIYDATNHTVTLIPAAHLNIHFHYQLTVAGVNDSCDNPIQGATNGKYITLITKHNYSKGVPAGPSTHVTKSTAWAAKYPRLAANHGHTNKG